MSMNEYVSSLVYLTSVEKNKLHYLTSNIETRILLIAKLFTVRLIDSVAHNI